MGLCGIVMANVGPDPGAGTVTALVSQGRGLGHDVSAPEHIPKASSAHAV